jgi:hypothetical protein
MVDTMQAVVEELDTLLKHLPMQNMQEVLVEAEQVQMILLQPYLTLLSILAAVAVLEVLVVLELLLFAT